METSIGAACPDEKRVIFRSCIEKIDDGPEPLRYTPAARTGLA
jgi:hypothetical protein